MQKISEIINPLAGVKEKLRLVEDKNTIDRTVETVKQLAGTINRQKERLVECEQKLWECETALRQLRDMGFEPGEKTVFGYDEKPPKTGLYLGKLKIQNEIKEKVIRYDGKYFIYNETSLTPGKDLMAYMKLPRFS